MEEHLLRHGCDDSAAGVTDDSSKGAATAGVHEALNVLQEPFVGAGRTVEPGRVVEADHSCGVAVQVQRPSADAGPVGRIAEQRGVQMRIVVERSRHPKPVAVRRFPGAV